MVANPHDRGFSAIGYSPKADCNTEDLDLLAAIIEREDLTQAEERKVAVWLGDSGKDHTPIEVANIILNRDDIPYHEYDCPEAPDWISNEEKLGRTMMNMEGEMLRFLKSHGIVEFFDFEKYGRECSYDYSLFDEGCLCYSEGEPSDGLYDREELQDLAEGYLPAPAKHGSKTLDEFKARMRDAGYEDWEIQEEVAEMIDSQEQVKRNTEEYRAQAERGSALTVPALASSFALYTDNSGYYHIFALDGEGNALACCHMTPLQEREVIKEIEALKEDPTLWRFWDATDYDPRKAFQEFSDPESVPTGGSKLIDEWEAELSVGGPPSIKDEGRSAIAASHELASSSEAKLVMEEVR